MISRAVRTLAIAAVVTLMTACDHIAEHASAHKAALAGAIQHADSGDTAFHAMQHRGMEAMGVDQYSSTHRFDALPDGGTVVLQRDSVDSAGVARIREHLSAIARAFRSGDFSTPTFVHLRDVTGASTMAERRRVIRYEYRDVPGGGEVRIRTRDSTALAAVHAFFAFQRMEHRTGG